MDFLLPPINAVGKFRLADPLSGLINTDINYKVIAIRSIRDMIDNGEDVLTYVYINQGLSEEDYQNDLSADIPIVTLLSPSDEYIYVPANRLLSIPDVTGYKFRNKVISVDLGYVPDDTDFSWLEDEIKDLVFAKYGVEPTVNTLGISQAYLYTKDEYDTFETQRLANVTDNSTCYSRLKTLEDEISLLKEKIAAVLKIKSV